VSDETKIAGLVFDYAFAYDERDLEGLRACFIDGATFSWSIVDGPSGGPFEGADAIVASNAASLASQNDRRRHVMTNVTIRGEGDERTVRSYMTLSAIASRRLICDLPF